MEAEWRLRVITDLMSRQIFCKQNWCWGMNRTLSFGCQGVGRYMFLASKSLHNLRGQKWSCLCYHARHLQQIHLNKLFCGMYGFTAKSSVPPSTTMSLINKMKSYTQVLIFVSSKQ